MGSKLKPGKFDCYAKAKRDEPMFVLLARDPHACEIVERWALLRSMAIDRGEKPKRDRALVSEALECSRAMFDWRRKNYTRSGRKRRRLK